MKVKLGVTFEKYLRLKEQILLLGGDRKRFSPEKNILICSLFHYSPSSNNKMWQTFFLTLPQGIYVRKLSLYLDSDCPEIVDEHVHYLKQRLSGSNEYQKLVNVLLN